MPASSKSSGAAIGIASGDAGRGVDDGGHAAVHQRARGGGVQVGVMNQRDVARSQPLRQVFGAPVFDHAPGAENWSMRRQVLFGRGCGARQRFESHRNILQVVLPPIIRDNGANCQCRSGAAGSYRYNDLYGADATRRFDDGA